MLVQGISAGPRRAPLEFQEAVELHFRKSGRHARIVWIPEPVCQWQVRITMKPNDPALRAFQAGETALEPVETVELTVFDEDEGLYIGVELESIGVSGLIDMLERGDMHSGQGDFDSLEEAMAYQVESQKKYRERLEKYVKDEVLAAGRAVRKRIMKEPYLRVRIDLPTSSPDGADNEEK